MASKRRTERSVPDSAREQLLAPQVSRGKPGPANHWPEVTGMITRQDHRRHTGKPVKADVAGRRTGQVRKSRDTIPVTQLDTIHVMEFVQGYGKITHERKYKGKTEGNEKSGRKRNKQRMKKILEKKLECKGKQKTSSSYPRLLRNRIFSNWKKTLIIIITLLIISFELNDTGWPGKDKERNEVNNGRKGFTIDRRCGEINYSSKFGHLMCPHSCTVKERRETEKSSYTRSRGKQSRHPEELTMNIGHRYMHIYNKYKNITLKSKYPLRNRNNGKTGKFGLIHVPGTGNFLQKPQSVREHYPGNHVICNDTGI